MYLGRRRYKLKDSVGEIPRGARGSQDRKSKDPPSHGCVTAPTFLNPRRTMESAISTRTPLGLNRRGGARTPQRPAPNRVTTPTRIMAGVRSSPDRPPLPSRLAGIALAAALLLSPGVLMAALHMAA